MKKTKSYDEDDPSVSSVSTKSSTSTSTQEILKPKKNSLQKNSLQKKSMDLQPPQKKKSPEELLQEELQEKENNRIKNKSKLSEYHKQFKTMRSDNLHQRFKENPDELFEYHYTAQQNEETYADQSEIPLNKIISKLEGNKHKKTKTLLDLGCGLIPKIRHHFEGDSRYEVRSFDHLSFDENVEECDISHLPIEDDNVDYVVLSLAMWGSNCEDYVREARRVLDSNGRLYIGEATKRWTPDITEEEPEHRPAQRLIDLLERNGFNIVESNIAKFSLFTCVKR